MLEGMFLCFHYPIPILIVLKSVKTNDVLFWVIKKGPRNNK